MKIKQPLISASERAKYFRALHQREGLLLIPNPWDAGSARVLAGLGFEALATSSSGFAGTLGRRDGGVTREEVLAHARSVVETVEIPVSADMENGFGHAPEFVAETIRLAADVGLAGASIEDFTGDKEKPLFEIRHAAERIAAAAEAARSLPHPFTLTARAENFFRGSHDLDDAIQRLVAYEKAGADVLFAPALPDLAAVREVCKAVSKPVNFMVGVKGKSFSLSELAEAGVKRVSFASSLYRAAMTGLLNAAREVKEKGTFHYLDQSVTTPEINAFMQG